MNKIDEILEYARLRWHRASGQPGSLSLVKEYGLVPIASILGTTNFVPKNKILSVLDKSEARVASHFQ